MPKPIADDLRRRLLAAWEAKEGSLRELALRFRVSYEFARKIRKQQRRTGKAERVPQSRHGFVSRVDESARAQLVAWIREQPDRTMAELQELLRVKRKLQISRTRVWQLTAELGFRRKKNSSRQRTRH